MAKSFHDIINSGQIEVSHKGEDVTLELPEVLKELKGILMDKESLLIWMKENEIELGVIHAGIQKIIIDSRAKARPSIDTKTGATKSIIDEKEKAQERMDDLIIKATLPPGSSTNPLKAAVKALKNLGMDLDTVIGILGDKFDPTEVKEMFNSL